MITAEPALCLRYVVLWVNARNFWKDVKTIRKGYVEFEKADVLKEFFYEHEIFPHGDKLAVDSNGIWFEAKQ